MQETSRHESARQFRVRDWLGALAIGLALLALGAAAVSLTTSGYSPFAGAFAIMCIVVATAAVAAISGRAERRVRLQ